MTILQKISAAYPYWNIIAHTTLSALGISALKILTEGAIPSWQTEMLHLSLFFVPLGIFLAQVTLVLTGFYEAHENEIQRRTGSNTAISKLITQAIIAGTVLWSFSSWNTFWLQLALPLLLTYAMIWTGLLVIAPLFHTMHQKNLTLKDIGEFLKMIAIFSIFSIPAGFLMIPILSYSIQTTFTNHITIVGTLYILSIFWYALRESWFIVGISFEEKPTMIKDLNQKELERIQKITKKK